MKALIVLCVLIGKMTADDLCSYSANTCGCCLMTKQLTRMDQFFTMTYDYLTDQLTATTQALNDIRASRTVFSAILNNPNQDCNTQVPGSTNVTVVYNNVVINQGGNYDGTTGVYTAPRRGVYNFAATLYNLGTQKSCATLMVNGVVKYTLMERQAADTQDSASLSMTLLLEAGDKIKMVQPAGCVMCARDNLYNTFTGFLLYATA